MSKILIEYSKKLGRILTSSLRATPSFIVIGVQKGGTTSLFNYLIQHPHISKPYKKEIGFFDIKFGSRSNAWYKSFFPTFLAMHQRSWMTGEASTGYIYHPHAPKRIKQLIPQAKLIVLLRNPVDRAYSHYCHTKKLGRENLSFEEAISKEEERVNALRAKIEQDKCYYHENYHLYTYLSRGIYVEQLKNWLRVFSKKQILVLKSEDFFANPSTAVKQVLSFLELPYWEAKHYKQHNPNSYKSTIEPTTRKNLIAYYKPHNENLYQLLGTNFDWDK